MQKGKILIFSAPSGAGKTTIVKHLIAHKEFNLEFSISACSRKIRGNEKHKKDYYFLSVDDFKKKIENDEFVEWEEVYEQQYYGTLKSELYRIWNRGKNVIFDVDVMGGLNIKKKYPQDSLTFFIEPPSIRELKQRLINRSTDNDEQIKKRIKKAEIELSYANSFDKIIVNDVLEQTVEEVVRCVNSFLLDK